jgi:hypothetical protein
VPKAIDPTYDAVWDDDLLRDIVGVPVVCVPARFRARQARQQTTAHNVPESGTNSATNSARAAERERGT